MAAACGPDAAVPTLAGHARHLPLQGEAGCTCLYFLKPKNKLKALLLMGLDRVHACTAFQAGSRHPRCCILCSWLLEDLWVKQIGCKILKILPRKHKYN